MRWWKENASADSVVRIYYKHSLLPPSAYSESVPIYVNTPVSTEKDTKIILFACKCWCTPVGFARHLQQRWMPFLPVPGAPRRAAEKAWGREHCQNGVLAELLGILIHQPLWTLMADCTACLGLCIFIMNFDRSPIRISSEEHWKEIYRTEDRGGHES